MPDKNELPSQDALEAEIPPPPPVKKQKLTLMDHNYHIYESPKTLKKKLDKTIDNLTKTKRQLKLAKEKSRRLKKRVTSLKSVVQCLKKRGLISLSCQDQLEQSLSGVPLHIMKRLTSNKRSGRGCKYPAELKSFALTLQFYSAKAYEYVRKTFNLALPHQAQIRKWYSKVPAEPGFTETAFTAIKSRVDAAKI